uniref:Uncharacterized protein n=1 Tax=Cairina moschata TaxID=8855 RepID=A0A8C3GNZ4_CAIMO
FPAFGTMPVGGGLLCAASGLALLVTATATDFWLQHRAPGGTAAIGLWHLCLGGCAQSLQPVPGALCHAPCRVPAASPGLAAPPPPPPCPVGVLALLGLAVCTAGARSLLGPAPGAWRLSWSYLLAWVAVVLTGSAGTGHRRGGRGLCRWVPHPRRALLPL